ncbi:MAG: SpoIVB peptidase [Roseburia sp.]|nr:SpoIVB peptidase [Roseburia sp.]
MRKKKCFEYEVIKKLACIGFFFVAALAVWTFQAAIPDQIYVTEGSEISYDFEVPVSVVLKEEDAEVFDNLSDTVYGKEEPAYTVTCKLFGIFPVKDVEVMLVDKESVYASGMPVGIYAKTNGVLIIGTGAVEDATGKECRPAENLVKSGDYIVSVNGDAVDEKEELVEKINQYGGASEVLGIRRESELLEVSVDPVRGNSGNYMLGIWVRDDLAGVGTLTYYKADGSFGALGHAVSDGDTGTMLQMSQGWIYTTDIIGIKKGESGKPGELSGIIDYSKNCRLGTIRENTGLGIRGVLDGNLDRLERSENYEVAYKQDIKKGKAYIVSSLSGERCTYEINIQSLDYSGREANKGILFQVTDPKLIELTGGIVQGMSGSPIIQDGKIIGAVTHVFVSDSTKGYGIFIENMLDGEAIPAEK